QPKDDFLEGMAILKKSMITVQKIRAEGKLPKQIVAKVDALAPVWIPLQNVIDSLPVVLGFDHKKVYLVLLQNNMELRPGGGFIGSYGLLRVKNGAIEDFSVHDVYDADGKLTFHIEPPYGLRRYLGASHWFLRDSNFAIDFPQNASQAMTFLELETGEKVDGVIALDTTFFKNLLEAFTSVNVPEYKETITPENFYLRTQTHVEKDFFPGSTQKKDFLQALLNAMEERLASRQDVSYDVLVDKLGESIRGKHVLFSFRDEAVQKLFVVTGISSTLWDSRSSRENTFLDTFGVIDANVGVNKANYYLTREIEQKVSISASGTIQTTARVLYTNTSKRDSQFGGDYKNFVRFILPAQAVIRSIRIDGVDQEIVPAVTDPAIFTDNDFVPPEGLEVAIVNEQDKTTVGFLVLVPRGKSKTVNVTYEVVRAISPQEPVFDYALWVYKQPGTVGDSYSFSVSYPESYQIIRKDDALSDVGGKLVYSDLLSEDTYFTVGFSKK
ncbi:MAG TPA: DUF4012 domain-containing protein, partial [Patescibacteria group bacterium]|nr:DUF4012 domain-containing protein [Patescibacteria group bacterium]